jgi:hypothetical protein
MLARTPYLTAQELGIREIEHEYLSRFVQEGEQGKLPEQHRFDLDLYFTSGAALGDEYFSCSSIGCIAGTMQAYALRDGREKELYASQRYRYSPKVASKPLHALFEPHGVVANFSAVALSQAVACTKNFLQTGKVEWEKFIGEQA